MSIIVILTPAEEARLAAEAMQDGVAPSELAAKLLHEHLTPSPESKTDVVRAKLRQWQRETWTETLPEISTHDLFAEWDAEDAEKTEEELSDYERLTRGLQESVDQERTLARIGATLNA